MRLLLPAIISFLDVSLCLSEQRFESKPYFENAKAEGGYIIKIEREKTFAAALNSDPVAYFTKWLWIATTLLALFTAGLAVVTIMIWRDGKKTSAKQNVASRRMLIHSAQNAKASQEAAALARDTLIATNRAWIKPILEDNQDFYISKHQEKINVSFSIEIKNIGSAPARNINLFVLAYANDEVVEIKCEESRNRGITEGHSLFPNEIITVRKGCEKLTIDELRVTKTTTFL